MWCLSGAAAGGGVSKQCPGGPSLLFLGEEFYGP